MTSAFATSALALSLIERVIGGKVETVRRIDDPRLEKLGELDQPWHPLGYWRSRMRESTAPLPRIAAPRSAGSMPRRRPVVRTATAVESRRRRLELGLLQVAVDRDQHRRHGLS